MKTLQQVYILKKLKPQITYPCITVDSRCSLYFKDKFAFTEKGNHSLSLTDIGCSGLIYCSYKRGDLCSGSYS